MIAKFTGSIWMTTLVLSSITVLSVNAEAPSVTTAAPVTDPTVSTIFRCVWNGGGFATIAQRGDRITPPLITWNSQLGKYTPQERCNVVSQKLTAAVAENSGKLRNLQLLAGAVNHQVVICVVNNMQPACNKSNMLFTLRPENARKPDEVLARLYDFSIKGSGAPIAEADNLEPVPLESLNQFLGPEDTADSQTTSPNPMPNPQ